MPNNLAALNDQLFKQLERLNDDALGGEKLIEEIKRTEAVTTVATKVIDIGSLCLKASLSVANSLGDAPMPSMLVENVNKDRKMIG